MFSEKIEKEKQKKVLLEKKMNQNIKSIIHLEIIGLNLKGLVCLCKSANIQGICVYGLHISQRLPQTLHK